MASLGMLAGQDQELDPRAQVQFLCECNPGLQHPNKSKFIEFLVQVWAGIRGASGGCKWGLQVVAGIPSASGVWPYYKIICSTTVYSTLLYTTLQ